MTFTADGFLLRGDLGIKDAEAYARIVDRKKDMIIVSGFRVSPVDLENLISKCPGVVQCAAVDIANSMQGECITGFVLRNGPLLTEEVVNRF